MKPTHPKPASRVVARIALLPLFLLCVQPVTWSQRAGMPGEEAAEADERGEEPPAAPFASGRRAREAARRPAPRRPRGRPSSGSRESEEGARPEPDERTREGEAGSSSREREGASRATRPVGLSLALGEFRHEVTDLVLRGRGLDLRWTRRYRSRAPELLDTPQGIGWDHAYNVYVERVAPGVLVMHPGNGRADRFVADASGTYACVGQFYSGVELPDGSFRFTFRHGGTWQLAPLDGAAAEGKLTAIADRAGNTLSFSYDAMGRLAAITDTVGRVVTVTYGADGRIDSVSAPGGRTHQYTHYGPGDPDGEPGDLASVTTPPILGTPTGNDFPGGKTTTYTYSKHAIPELAHNLLSITSPSGERWLENDYAATTSKGDLAFDRVVRQRLGTAGDETQIVYRDATRPSTGSLGTRALRRLVLVNDGRGIVTEYTYDARNLPLAVRELTGFADPTLPTTRLANRPAGKLRPGDPDHRLTRYAYNAEGLLWRVVHPEGDEEHYTYRSDLEGPFERWQADRLRVRRRLPGPRGASQAVLVERWSYDADHGYVSRFVDPLGLVSEHDHDAAGNRIQTRLPEGGLVHDWSHDGFGQVVTHHWPDDGTGHRRMDAFTYHGAGPQLGRLATFVRDAGPGGLALTRSYTWSAVGDLLNVTDERGGQWSFVRNQVGQVVQRLGPAVSGQGGVRYREDFVYDLDDDLVRIDVENRDETGALDPNALLTTTYVYDSLHRVTRIIEEIGVGTDAVQELDYDANGNCTERRTDRAVSGQDPAHRTRLTYDERDLLLRETRAPGTPDASSTEYDYDDNGNVVRRRTGIESSPRATTWAYDGYDRQVSRVDPMGNEQRSSYDAGSRVTEHEWLGETVDVPGSAGNVRLARTTYDYDDLGRILRVARDHEDDLGAPIGGGTSETELTWAGLWGPASVTDPRLHVETRSYDRAGRLDVVTDAAGNTLDLDHDATDRVVSRTEQHLSDLGAPPSFHAWTGTYDELGRLASLAFPGGDTATFEYDSRGNLRAETDREENVTRYTYDGLDRRILVVRELTDTGTGTGVQVGDQVRVLDWDPTLGLIGVTDDNGFQTTYAYDSLSRLVRIDLPDQTSRQYAYDAHDDRILETDANGTAVTYAYDANGRLVSSSIVPGPGVAANTTLEGHLYDGLSRCVSSADDDSSVGFTYDTLGNVLSESLTVQTLAGPSTSTSRVTRDAAGNATSLTAPDLLVFGYEYDDLDRVRTVQLGATLLATHDWVGPRARLERRTNANGTVTDWSYDASLRPVRAVTTRGMATLLDRTASWTRTGVAASRGNPLNGGTSFAFAIDSLGRLAEALETPPLGAPSMTTYALDDEGNRTSVAGGANPGAYTRSAVLPDPGDAQVNQYTSTPSDERLYDANGNLLARDPIGAAPADTFVYDAFDRLVSYTDGDTGLVTEYAYDALDRRIRVVEDALGSPSEALRHHAGARLVQSRDALGVTQETIVPVGLDGAFDANGFVSNGSNAGTKLLRPSGATEPRGLRLGGSAGARGVDGIAWQGGGGDLLFPGAATACSTSVQAGYMPIGGIDGEATFAAPSGIVGCPGESVLLSAEAGTPVVGFLNWEGGGGDTFLRGAGSTAATLRNGTTYFHHVTPQGNVAGLSDDAGLLVESYEYGDFGDVRTFDAGGMALSQSAVGNRYLLRGMEHAPESGTHYRGPAPDREASAGTLSLENTILTKLSGGGYFEPEVGRFTSRQIGLGDGIAGAGGDGPIWSLSLDVILWRLGCDADFEYLAGPSPAGAVPGPASFGMPGCTLLRAGGVLRSGASTGGPGAHGSYVPRH